MASPENTEDNALFVWLITLMNVFSRRRKLGQIYGSRVALRLDDKHGPEPDIAFIRSEHLDRVERGGRGSLRSGRRGKRRWGGIGGRLRTASGPLRRSARSRRARGVRRPSTCAIAATSTAITPSTRWPVFAVHIWAARAALASNCGDRARFRHSRLGCCWPHRAARSPVRGTRSSGSTRSGVGRKVPRVNWPSLPVTVPAAMGTPHCPACGLPELAYIASQP